LIPGAVKASAAKPTKKTRKVRWQIDCAVSPIRKIVLGFLLGIGQSRKHSRGRFPGPPGVEVPHRLSPTGLGCGGHQLELMEMGAETSAYQPP
jgi:hypothetical protein